MALPPIWGHVGVVVAEGAPGPDHLLDLTPVEVGEVGGVAEVSEPLPGGLREPDAPEVEERTVGVGEPALEVEEVDEVLDRVKGGRELGEWGERAPRGPRSSGPAP